MKVRDLLLIMLGCLLLSNGIWALQFRALARESAQASESLYYENEANDRAATECAVKTGFRYNCADGSQRVSCDK